MMGSRTTKMALAREQLEDGIALFLSGRHVSALTLLGAAEEVFARIIEERTGAHPLEQDWLRANRIRSLLGNPHISKQEIFRIHNAGRNLVKHHTPGDPVRVTHERFAEAFMMIQRAIGCADGLRIRYRGKKEYRRWYIDAGWGRVSTTSQRVKRPQLRVVNAADGDLQGLKGPAAGS